MEDLEIPAEPEKMKPPHNYKDIWNLGKDSNNVKEFFVQHYNDPTHRVTIRRSNSVESLSGDKGSLSRKRAATITTTLSKERKSADDSLLPQLSETHNFPYLIEPAEFQRSVSTNQLKTEFKINKSERRSISFQTPSNANAPSIPVSNLHPSTEELEKLIREWIEKNPEFNTHVNFVNFQIGWKSKPQQEISIRFDHLDTSGHLSLSVPSPAPTPIVDPLDSAKIAKVKVP